MARGGTAELTNTILTADEVRDLVERMLKSSGRRVDLSSPFVDATLPDGSRLHVVIPDITGSGVPFGHSDPHSYQDGQPSGTRTSRSQRR